MAKKHNVSDIISDKLYCSIKNSIDKALGFKLDYWAVKVDDDERLMTVDLPYGLKMEAQRYSKEWWDVVCREDYFDKVYEFFPKQWEPNPFDDIDFDEEDFTINLHFTTDNVIKELEEEMEGLGDCEILVPYNKNWCKLINFDDTDFKKYFCRNINDVSPKI